MMAKILEKVKNAGIGVWLGIVAAVLALVTMIMGASGNALLNNTSFGADVIIVLILGLLISLAGFWFRFNFWQLMPTLLYSVSLGLVFNGGLPVLMDRFNNVVYSGGDFNSVVIYLVLLGLACLLSIVACFTNPTRGREASKK